MGAFHDLLTRGGTIDVRVDYYSDDHAKLLAAYTEAETIRTIAGSVASIPVAELLTYCIFIDKTPSISGLCSYDTIKSRLDERLTSFNDGLELTPRSLRTRLIGNDQIDRLTEKIGVGVALTIANRIHGLKEADWIRIPQDTTKTLDFKHACTNTGYVQVEAKGAAVADNTTATKFWDKAASIEAKKEVLRGASSPIPVTAYGTIAAMDQRADSTIQCWLLDPPADAPRRDPRHQRILNRLQFAAEIFETIIPQSIITTELNKRINILAQSENVSEFDKVPLVKRVDSREQNIFATHDHDIDNNFFGVTINLSDERRFFYGIRREWLNAAIDQNFEILLGLTWEPGTEGTQLSLRASTNTGLRGQAAPEILAKDLKRDGPRSRPQIEFSRLNTTSSGRVFGFVGLFEQRKDNPRIANY